MQPMPALTPHLKQLRLSGILDSLEARNRQAIDAKLSYVDFLALLFETPLPVVSEERASFGRQMVAHGGPITGTAAARMRSH